MKKTSFLILFLFNVTLISAQKIDWVLRKDKRGVKIFTRVDELTGIIEFKASTIIETSIDTILDVFHNVEGYTQWMADTKESKVLSNINENESYIYFEASVPWPLENRDMPLYQKITKTENGLNISLKGEPEYIPEKKGITRINQATGSWDFVLLQNSKIELTYHFMADPGLNIPNWVINIFIVDGPYKTILALKEIIKI